MGSLETDDTEEPAPTTAPTNALDAQLGQGLGSPGSPHRRPEACRDRRHGLRASGLTDRWTPPAMPRAVSQAPPPGQGSVAGSSQEWPAHTQTVARAQQ